MLQLLEFGKEDDIVDQPDKDSEESLAESGLKLTKFDAGENGVPPLPSEVKKAKLKIVPFSTDKSKIKIRPNMKSGIIPTHPSSVIFNGRSGSGKSNLIINLLCRPEFYGTDDKGKHYFDQVYMFSPTAGLGDDLVKHLIKYAGLKEENVFNEINEEKLMEIIKRQEQKIKSTGIARSPRILLLLDDIQSEPKFLRSKTCLKVFIQNRHINISTWIASQVFNLIPRGNRLQANNLFIFPCSNSEEKRLVDEFTPPRHTKREFEQLFAFATAERYEFLHINMREPPKTRFRKNLDQILKLKK